MTAAFRIAILVFLTTTGPAAAQSVAPPESVGTIFRVASQSKAVTSVGAMMLVEEGRMLLNDPVAKYIPAFENTSVRGPGSGATMNPVAPRRRITIRDLLTHTAGVS